MTQYRQPSSMGLQAPQTMCRTCACCLLCAKSIPVLQVKKDFQEIVLSARQDDFYRRHMYSNFGDAGAAVKGLVDEFQRQSASSQNINTIEDMQVRASGA